MKRSANKKPVYKKTNDKLEIKIDYQPKTNKHNAKQ